MENFYHVIHLSFSILNSQFSIPFVNLPHFPSPLQKHRITLNVFTQNRRQAGDWSLIELRPGHCNIPSAVTGDRGEYIPGRQ